MSEKRVGKATLVTIKKAADKSAQLEEQSKFCTNNDLIDPPYNLEVFLKLYESNSTFSAVVQQIAKDVAGLGYNFILKDGESENSVELTKAKDFLVGINPEDSFQTLCKELLVDYCVCGYFGIEVIRNLKGEISQLLRLPAHTFRIHKSKTKFCQLRDEKKVFFNKFGNEEKISSKTGQPIVEGSEDVANELIYYKNMYLSSDYYGVPNIISALGDLIGLIESRDYNIAFFKNGGRPSSILTLEGDWEEGTEKVIEKFMKTETSGSVNAHKNLILRQVDGCKLVYTELGEQIKESSFRNYSKDNRENILIAYSMPPQRVGIYVAGALSGDSTFEANSIYKAGTVEPLQCDLENIMNKILVTLGVLKYEFKFVDLDLVDKTAESTRVTALVNAGVLTINEARAELGFVNIGPAGDILLIPSTSLEIPVVEKSLQKDIKKFEDKEKI